MRAVVRSGLAVACAVALLSCKGEVTGPLTGVQQYIAKVALAGGAVTATLVRGDAPAAGASPVVDATIPSQAINGGSSEVALTSTDQFTVVIIAVDGQTDYYRLTLPAAATLANLVITLAQQIPTGSFDLVLGAGASATAIGPYVSQTMALVTVGTGDVQVSVSWNTAADVDLHVVDPSSEEIYYGNDIAASGGELDLDSNAACGTDGPRNENVTWADGTAPSGTYIVRLDYWSNCGAASTNYVVTVHVTGKATQTFTGSFTGSGDAGGQGDGTQITTFTK
jgi:hypothetical protein